MDKFEYLKEQARQSYRQALHETEQADKMKMRTRHAADQAQGAKEAIEALLTEAPEAELPAIRDAYAKTVESCEAAEESYLQAEASYINAVSSTDRARQRFLEVFKEEP